MIQKRKIVKSVRVDLPDGKVIKSLQEGENYKYLGILGQAMKLKVSKQFLKG